MNIGDVIDGKYEILRLIGEGGMGSVWEVRHVKIGRRLALKSLHQKYAENTEMVARFVREAQAAAAIGSEHIVEVTDAGELEDGMPYIVMEYLDGQDLCDILKNRGKFDERYAVELVLQVCEGLTAAHQQGIIHRDLKPGNVMLVRRSDGSEWIKVLDFGVAKVRDAMPTLNGEISPELTSTSATLGTPFYMAPEQAWGSKTADARSDVYAVGVILFELLTGIRPFQADTYNELIIRVATAEPEPPSEIRKDLSTDLEAIILKAMAKDPDERFSSMAALSADLRAFLKGEPPLLSSTTPEKPSNRNGETSQDNIASVSVHVDRGTDLGFAQTAVDAADIKDQSDEDEDDQSEVEEGKSKKFPVVLSIVLGAVLLVGAGLFYAYTEGFFQGFGRPIADASFPPESDGDLRRASDDAEIAVVADAETDAEISDDGDISCPIGMVVNEDTWGHCCWPAQVWSKTQNECIGDPDCQGGTTWRGGACACPYGQIMSIDTRGNCCWPGQAWSVTQEKCIGRVRCPTGFKRIDRQNCEPNPDSAVGRLTLGCQEGELSKCVALAQAYRGGRNEEKAQALILLRQSCSGGSVLGCSELGKTFARGIGVEKNDAEAITAYLSGCLLNDPPSCTNVGELYQDGRGVKQDHTRASHFFEKGCKGLHMPGCVSLGQLFVQGHGGVRVDEKRAVGLFKLACDESNARGCGLLAQAYDRGQGIEQNAEQAAILAGSACKAGEISACRHLGQLYRHGRGVKQDHSRAVTYAKKACDGGEPAGCRDLGLLYQKGLGVRQNFKTACQLYQKACDQGDAFGCRNLAIRYRRGEGVAQDNGRAARYYRLACDKGDARGCALAGDHYISGLGVRKNKRLGTSLLRKGCKGGDDWACERLRPH